MAIRAPSPEHLSTDKKILTQTDRILSHNGYVPLEVEWRAQTHWNKQNTFIVQEELSQEKFYCLAMLPYPSGDLHMGHVRNYTLSDVIARYARMHGKNVLQPMGWDAFGLPAENAAIRNDISPAEWTQNNIDCMRTQMKQLGFGIDWSREIKTNDPEYYRWEQWLFLRLYHKGLAYKKTSTVNWDPVDQTVLANEQVVQGRGWRSGALIERKELSQWFLKITAYADELLDALDTLKQWPEAVRTMQKNWIGRSHGLRIAFLVPDLNAHIDIFTTRPDTLFGVSFLAVSFAHPIAQEAAVGNAPVSAFITQCHTVKVAEAELQKDFSGIFSGLYALHPITQDHIPIWITRFVLMEYGTGAVMGVPGHDTRDQQFALRYGLPIYKVVVPDCASEAVSEMQVFCEPGTLINSHEYSKLSTQKGSEAIAHTLMSQKKAFYETQYRLRDWCISRQRYWGTPIPIIYCPNCGILPVPESDLPITLPTHIQPTGHGSPLALDQSFYEVSCHQCGALAHRETDTMDTFMESSWYYARYCCWNQDQAMLDDRAQYWTPVDQYIGGIEHANMHLLYARFIHKVLRDEQLLNSNEPFYQLLTQGMVLKDGMKMSKSHGNVVQPKELIELYGADSVRLFVLFAAPAQQSLEWSDQGLLGCYRFLCKLWHLGQSIQDALLVFHQNTLLQLPCSDDAVLKRIRRCVHKGLKQAHEAYQKQQWNTVVPLCMTLRKELSLLDITQAEHLSVLSEGMRILLQLLAPMAPHIAHVLWQDLGFGEEILDSSWPKPNMKILEQEETLYVIQINGKIRHQIQCETGMTPHDLELYVLKQEKIQKFLQEKTIKKIIIVPNKLVNIVTN